MFVDKIKAAQKKTKKFHYNSCPYVLRNIKLCIDLSNGWLDKVKGAICNVFSPPDGVILRCIQPTTNRLPAHPHKQQNESRSPLDPCIRIVPFALTFIPLQTLLQLLILFLFAFSESCNTLKKRKKKGSHKLLHSDFHFPDILDNSSAAGNSAWEADFQSKQIVAVDRWNEK